MVDDTHPTMASVAELAAARTQSRILADTERQLRLALKERDDVTIQRNDLRTCIAAALVVLAEPNEGASAQIAAAREHLQRGASPDASPSGIADRDAAKWHEIQSLFARRGVSISTPREILALCDALARKDVEHDLSEG